MVTEEKVPGEGNPNEATGGKPPPLRIKTRWITCRDFSDVVRIDAATASNGPWTEAYLEIALKPKHCVGIVAEHEGIVVGFVIYEMRKDKLRFIRIGVDPQYRLRSVGRQMVEFLIHRHFPVRRKIELMIDERNLGAQQFFQKCGFVATGLHRKYFNDFDDVGSDGYKMGLTRDSVSGWQQRVEGEESEAKTRQ
jgi:ribosomal-protein-alanine N-acetyltransferase